jgi:3-deoxy-7-phosphoheptulonate synthase
MHTELPERTASMFVVMKPQSSPAEVKFVTDLLHELGVDSTVVEGPRQSVIELFSGRERVAVTDLETAPMVERVLEDSQPVLAGKRTPGDPTQEIVLPTGGTIGGNKIAVIAGPCSIESEGQLRETAAAVKRSGAIALRGGAFKPRTSPHSFQGLGEKGLEMLARARAETDLAIVTEVMCCEQVDLVRRYADVLQIGSRNMQNTHLLLAVGRQEKPVLLKRGWGASIEEFLLAAEYIVGAGNRNVILCERGIRTFETYVRNTLALSIIPEIKRRSPLPILVDPSHGTGKRHLVTPMSYAAVACGADGLLIEVHPKPQEAWSDGFQTLDAGEFQSLMDGLPALAQASGRSA